MNPVAMTTPVLAVIGPAVPIPMAAARVPAGFPSPADDQQDESLDLSRRFVRNPTATFLVQVSGTSLWGIGIRPVDVLLVNRSRTPVGGDVVLAIVDGDFTATRFICYG